MKRISFGSPTPRSKNQLRKTAFLAAIFLLLFANLFAFSLAEDFPGDPNGEAAQGEADGGAGGENGTGEETGDTGGGTGGENDTNGENGEPGDGEFDENGEPAEPGDDEASAVSRLSEDIMLLASINVSNEDALRAAVSGAPTNGMLYVIEVRSGVTLTGELRIEGGRNITLTAASGVILQQNNYAIVIDGAGLTLDGGLTLSGGGVTNRGTFTMNGGAISGHVRDHNTGVCVTNGGGTFTMNDGVISGYSEDDFGVLINGTNSIFIMNGGTIKDCGLGVYTSGIFTMNDGVIRNNDSTETSDYGRGGGVFNLSMGTFTMNGGTISGNKAEQGGGVYNTGVFTMHGGTISGNEADEGGGVYSESQYVFMMDGGAIKGNTATESGGGLYNLNRYYTETMILIDSEISGNYAATGGGIANTGYLCMAGVTLSDNHATAGGGGLYHARNPQNSSARLRFGSDFTSYEELSSADTRIECNTADLGGGLYFADSSGYEGEGYDSVRVEDNTAKNGGGIYFADEGRLFDVMRVAGNHAVAKNGSGGLGGGVYAAKSFDIHGARVSGNDAADGGGVYFAGSYFQMTGFSQEGTVATVENNIASRDGGGLYLAAGEAHVSGGAIRNNTASFRGGGLYQDDTHLSFFSDAAVSYNTAKFGGGLYVTDYENLQYGHSYSGHAGFNVGLSGNRATAGTFLPSEAELADLRAAYPYAGLYYEEGGAFLRYSRPELRTAFTNDDINWLPVTGVTVTYQDSEGHAASGMPSPSAVTVTATRATEETFAGDAFHRLATAPRGLGNFVFKGWRLVGNALAFLNNDADTLRTLDGETDEIILASGRFIRPLVNIVLDAVWGVNTGGGGGGRPPGGGDDEGGGGGDGGDGGDGDPEPPGPEPPGPGPTPPTPTPNPPTTGTTPARPVAPAATVVANVLPDLPAPEPEPEPVLEAEAPAPPAPPAETPAPPSVNAFENFLATTGIAPFGIPLAAPSGSAWAILNLILAVLSVACAAFAILRLLKGRAGDASEGAYGETATAGDPRRAPGFPYTILATIGAFVSLITFILTENVSLAPAWLDRFSPFMLVLCGLCAVFAALAARAGRASRADADFEDAV